VPRILIAGVGSIGKRHRDNLLQLGCTDVMLCHTSVRPPADNPDEPCFTDLSGALAAKPDIVMVCSPTAQHMDVALPAAEAGCNLFVEKPVSHLWDGVEQLLSLVSDQGLLAMVGFDLRFDPGLCKAQELIDNGQIGRVVAIHAQVGQYLPDWRPHEDYRKGMSARIETGGGVILDLIHELDYVSWLAGPVSRIACFAENPSHLEIETEAVASIAMQFDNGAIGSVNLDYIQRSPSRTCRIIGDEGTIMWDYFANKIRWHQAETDTWQEYEYSEFGRNDRFICEMRHMLSCLDGNEQPKVDLVAGAAVLKLALAAKVSATEEKVCQIV